MIEKMGYNLTKRSGLNFSKGRRTLIRSFVPNEKAPDYYRMGLGYVSTPASSDFEAEQWVLKVHLDGVNMCNAN